MIDNNASNVVSYWYSDFGEVTEVKGTNYNDFVNEIQYTGAIYDKLSGLTYLNARFYDASTGRFISQDSYRGERNNADTWHLYLYCANDPINYVDPSGHKSWKVPTDLVGYIIDAIATALGVGASFSAVKVMINRIKSNKKFYNEALQMVKEFLVVVEKKVNNAGERIKSFLKIHVGLVGEAIFKIGTHLINYRIDKIQSRILTQIIKTLPYMLSIGSFVAGLIDFSIHNKTLKGYIWIINGLKSWQVKLLNRLFC